MKRLKLCGKPCRLKPNDAESRHQLGLVCNETGDVDQSRKELELVGGLDPRHASAWHNLGLAQNASGQIHRGTDVLALNE